MRRKYAGRIPPADGVGRKYAGAFARAVSMCVNRDGDWSTLWHDGMAVVVVCAVAGGSGDAVFGVNLVLGILRQSSLRVVMVVRDNGGGGSSSGVVTLARWCVECLTDEAADWRRLALYSTDACGISSRVSATADAAPLALGGACDEAVCIVQAPLFVFDSVDAACAALGMSTRPTKGLVTVREFGHGRFCGTMGCAEDTRDVAAGIGADEMGVFDVTPPTARASTGADAAAADDGAGASGAGAGAAAAAAAAGHADRAGSAAQPHYVGYFRSSSRVRHFARVIVALECICVRSPSQLHIHVWWLAEYGDKAFLVRCLNEAAATAVRCPRMQFVCAHASGDGTDGSDGGTDGGDGGRGGDGDGDAAVVHVHDLSTTRLSLQQFRVLLHTARGAVVTGDQSVNEALCFGTPLWYASPAHKVFFARDLDALAAGSGVALVRQLWAYVAGTVSLAEWQAVVSEHAGDAADAYAAVRQHFSALAASLRRTLVDRVLDLIGP
jgi:hypothetical protein